MEKNEPQVILFEGKEYTQEEYLLIFNKLFLTELEKVKGVKHGSNSISVL